ncbi:MAG: DUF1801 domain-containing protein [Rhodothermales bacterium]|nr:DUF1801 domain-containing protein [Rhodothermales bacterium]
MRIEADTVDEYLELIPEDRKEAIQRLRAVILENLPEGFEETIQYNMPCYVVPHNLYPPGYHCEPKDPLPFLSFASQKNFVAVYHMGLYADPVLLAWFEEEFPKHSSKKLDMGKSCIRFKNASQIPFDLIGELAAKTTVADWIALYERAFRR